MPLSARYEVTVHQGENIALDVALGAIVVNYTDAQGHPVPRRVFIAAAADQKRLGLTADQKKQLKSLKRDQRKQIDAVRNDSSLNADQKQAKIKEIHQAGMEKRDTVLTPEQREKLKKEEAATG